MSRGRCRDELDDVIMVMALHNVYVPHVCVPYKYGDDEDDDADP